MSDDQTHQMFVALPSVDTPDGLHEIWIAACPDLAAAEAWLTNPTDLEVMPRKNTLLIARAGADRHLAAASVCVKSSANRKKATFKPLTQNTSGVLRGVRLTQQRWGDAPKLFFRSNHASWWSRCIYPIWMIVVLDGIGLRRALLVRMMAELTLWALSDDQPHSRALAKACRRWADGDATEDQVMAFVDDSEAERLEFSRREKKATEEHDKKPLLQRDRAGNCAFICSKVIYGAPTALTLVGFGQQLLGSVREDQDRYGTDAESAAAVKIREFLPATEVYVTAFLHDLNNVEEA